MSVSIRNRARTRLIRSACNGVNVSVRVFVLVISLIVLLASAIVVLSV